MERRLPFGIKATQDLISNSPETPAIAPIEVSPAAADKLAKWGMSQENIELLANFSSQFRYDLCLEKITELTKSPAIIYRENYRTRIYLPGLVAHSYRYYGQCGDIAKQWVMQINDFDVLKKLNNTLSPEDGNKIVSARYGGQSSTHFSNPNDYHMWNGLALVDGDGEMKDEIYIDAAFRKIMLPEESGYTAEEYDYNINNLEAVTSPYIVVNSIKDKILKSTAYNPVSYYVIGVSSDFKFGYLLGFFRLEGGKKIFPIVGRVDPDGKRDWSYYTDDHLHLHGGHETADTRSDETLALLRAASQIQFTKGERPVSFYNWSANPARASEEVAKSAARLIFGPRQY